MQGESWIAAVPALIAAVALLLAPGAVVVARLRLGFVAAIAAAGLVSALSIGVAGIVFGLLGLPFQAWQVAVPAVVFAAVAWLIDRRRIGAAVPRERSPWRWLLVTWIAAGAVIAVVAFAGVPDPGRVSQTYDNVFHMSAVAAILDHGSASSLTLRTLIETDRAFAFYPAVWHTLVAAVSQLSGASPVVAANASWIAVAAVVWVPGAAWLAQVLLVRQCAGRVGLVAMPLATGFAAMPYALLSWGSLYPTFTATALLPAAIAVPVLAGRVIRDAVGPRRWRATLLGSLAVGAVVVTVALAQPRVAVSGALLIAPLVLARAFRLVRAALAAGGTTRRRALWSLAGAGAALVLAASGAFVYLVVRLGLFDRPLDARLGGPQAAATQSVGEGLLQVLLQQSPTGVLGAVTLPALPLAAAVLVGIVAASRRAGLRWVVVAYLAVAVLFALAAGSDDVVAKLATALWYKDRYRLVSVVPVFGVALATLGILTVTRWMRRRAERAETGVAAALSWAAAATSAVVLVAGGATGSIAYVFRLPASQAQTEVVSAAQIAFFGRLGDIVPADQRVLGDPWDGSAWTGLFGRREPVFPHVNGQWDADRLTLAYHLPDIDADPAVCAALDALRVRYLVYSDHEFGGGDPSGNHFPGPHAAVAEGLFTPVTSDGETTLYRIDQCGALP